MKVKVLLCDDSEVFRNSISRFLKAEPLVNLVGEADSIEQTVKMDSDLRPNVIVLDLRMAAHLHLRIQNLKNRKQASRLLIVSATVDQDSRDLADAMGADAFLDKVELHDKLIPTIVWLSSDASSNRLRLQPI